MPTFIRFPALVGFMTAMASLRPPYIGVDMVSEPLPPDSVVDDPQKKKVNIRKKENQCQFEYGKGGTRLTFKLEYDDYSASIERYEAGHSLKMKTAPSPKGLALVAYNFPGDLQLTMNPTDVVETKMGPVNPFHHMRDTIPSYLKPAPRCEALLNVIMTNPPEDYEAVFVREEKGHLKLLDFGLCAEMDPPESGKLKERCGTPLYMSPEMIRGSYTHLYDLWAVGIIFFEMLYKDVPFRKSPDGLTCHDKIYAFPLYLSIPPKRATTNLNLSEDCREVLEGLLTWEKGRLTFEKLKSTAFFQSIRWESQHLAHSPLLPLLRSVQPLMDATADASPPRVTPRTTRFNCNGSPLPRAKTHAIHDTDRDLRFPRFTLTPDRMPDPRKLAKVVAAGKLPDLKRSLSRTTTSMGSRSLRETHDGESSQIEERRTTVIILPSPAETPKHGDASMAISDVFSLFVIILGLSALNMWFLDRTELQQPLEEVLAHLRAAVSLAKKTTVVHCPGSLLPILQDASLINLPEAEFLAKPQLVTSTSNPERSALRDLRCGAEFGGRKCDAAGDFPCCSAAGWCGSTSLHCDCDGCVDYRRPSPMDTECSEDRVHSLLTGPRGQRFKRLNSTELSGPNALWCYSSTCERDHRWFPLERTMLQAALHHRSNLNCRCMGIQCEQHAEGDKCYVKESARPLRSTFDRSVAEPQYPKLASSGGCAASPTLGQISDPRLTMLPFDGQPRDPDCDYIDTTYYDNFFSKALRLCDGAATKFYCTVTNNPFHPVAADNANLCWGEKIQLKPGLLRKSFRLKHRAWMSGTPDAYFTYQPGFLSGQCDVRAATIDYDNLFTGNYVRDFVESADWAGALAPSARVLSGATVLTWRESNGKREDRNLWHSYMHYLNIYQSLLVFGIEPGHDVRLIFLDNNIPVWHTEFINALAGEVLTVGDIQDEALLLSGPVIVAPSMHNTPFQATHYEVAIRCTHPLAAPVGLAYGILSHYNLTNKPIEVDKLRVLFLARRGTVTRQVQNEAELINMLKVSANVSVLAVDIATLSPRDQIAAVSSSDILITSHGAGATYVTFLPKYGGYLELWHDRQAHENECPIWCLFNHLALWSGIRHVDNWNPPRSYGFGSRAFPVDIETLRPQYIRLVENVRKSKSLLLEGICPHS
ncbi:hypothetical protein FOZ60_014898 [Perkinsus olseni]|uniref:non-specific serine/threonine protein kinase n=2 Tax=Perkinsus olseni TaxID=32597 RepID=A0A7J6P6L5_PEROL|nr:hypothetical protein FOZ60_014898 [Perkinsus olseni]